MPDLAGLELSHPWLLALALLAPFVFLRANRLPASVTYSSLALVESARPSLRARLAWLPAALQAFAVVAIVLALAGPRTGDSVSEVHREGIAIAMVVDRSSSMGAEMSFQGQRLTRLDVVKQVFEEFVTGKALVETWAERFPTLYRKSVTSYGIGKLKTAIFLKTVSPAYFDGIVQTKRQLDQDKMWNPGNMI